MKKYLLTSAVILCGIVAATLFTGCNKEDDVKYLKSYSYDVRMGLNSVCYASEGEAVHAAFNAAVGATSSNRTLYQSLQDDAMKAACESVRKQYADNLQSTYMVFYLYRTTIDATPGTTNIEEVIATYELGRALTVPYVKYGFSSNEETAFAELEAKKETLTEAVYNASRKTLLRLLGHHRSTGSNQSIFEGKFGDDFIKYWEDSENVDPYLVKTCDSIAAAHANDTLAVEAIVVLSKTGMLNGQVSEIWRKVFPANVE